MQGACYRHVYVQTHMYVTTRRQMHRLLGSSVHGAEPAHGQVVTGHIGVL
jgi:hypothetical protein